MICGAGNEDKEYVKKLALIYTLAGAKILDISANPEVVTYAKAGINIAYHMADQLSIDIGVRPYIMVSIGMPGDHHVRKSYIDPNTCLACGLCDPVCPTDAIPKNFHLDLDFYKNLAGSFDKEDQDKEIVVKDLCIGCGKCSNICPKDDIISYRHNARQLLKLLPECMAAGAECFELHAAVGDDDVTMQEWQLINQVNPDNFNSMCLDRLNLGNLNLEHRISQARDISNDKLIIQADGYPMSGGEDDYNTTLQAVACADVINKKFNMKIYKKKENNKISSKRVYKSLSAKKAINIIISGGTNSLSKKLADLCGVRINGVAVGTYARKIVNNNVQVVDFYNNYDNILDAVSKAKLLVDVNME